MINLKKKKKRKLKGREREKNRLTCVRLALFIIEGNKPYENYIEFDCIFSIFFMDFIVMI